MKLHEALPLLANSFLGELWGCGDIGIPYGAEVVLFGGEYGRKRPVFLGCVIRKEFDNRGLGCYIYYRQEVGGIREFWSRADKSIWRSTDYSMSSNAYYLDLFVASSVAANIVP